MNPTNRPPVPGVRPATFSEAAPWVAQALAAEGFRPSKVANNEGFLVEDNPGEEQLGPVRVTNVRPTAKAAAEEAERMMAVLGGLGARTEFASLSLAQFVVHAPDEIAHPMHWQWSERAEHTHCEDRHYGDPRLRKTTDKTKVTCPECKDYLNRQAEWKAKAEVERKTALHRYTRLAEAVQAADTSEAAHKAVEAVRAATLADQARSLKPGWTTHDPVHGEARILEHPQETRTDDGHPCVLVRARTLSGNVWLRYEESF